MSATTQAIRIAGRPDARAGGAWRRWAALPVVLAGTAMVVLDFFIVNVAMPATQADLHASAGAIEWVVAAYGLAFAAGLITAGRLGDQLGRRRMFSIGLALFTLTSAACGTRPRRARSSPRGWPRGSRRRCSCRRCWPSSASPTRATTARAPSRRTR